MNRIRIIAAVISITTILSMPALQVYASSDKDRQESCAQTLVKLGLLNGSPNGSLRLDSNIKRCEFVSLINRLMCYDTQAEAKDVKTVFKDISAKYWAYNDIKTAVKYGIITVYSDNTVRPEQYITSGEALEMMLKALGYKIDTSSSGQDGISDIIMNKAKTTGLDKNCELKPDSRITRGEAVMIAYNALTVDFADN